MSESLNAGCRAICGVSICSAPYLWPDCGNGEGPLSREMTSIGPLTSAMNFSLRIRDRSEPCILIDSLRTLNGGLARSYIYQCVVQVNFGEQWD
jgi:hypothetical protein